RAVRPQKAGHPAGPDLEDQAVDGCDGPVPLGQVVDLYHLAVPPGRVAVLFTAPAGAGTGPGRWSHDLGTAGPAAWSHDHSPGDRPPPAASSAASGQLASGRGGGQ